MRVQQEHWTHRGPYYVEGNTSSFEAANPTASVGGHGHGGNSKAPGRVQDAGLRRSGHPHFGRYLNAMTLQPFAGFERPE